MRTRTRQTCTTRPDVERLRRRLLAQAALFEHEKTYIAGVEDAITAMLELDDVVIHLEVTTPAQDPPDDPRGTETAPQTASTDDLPPSGGWFG